MDSRDAIPDAKRDGADGRHASHPGVPSLTVREKETLRLLLGGHDAKSIARRLGLSVHTINERLRDARRKLDVSSSREAARLLADAERTGPDSLGDKQLGVPAEPRDVPLPRQADRPHRVGHRLAWLSGGMFLMSLLIAAIALSSAFHATTLQQSSGAGSPVTATDASASASLPSARAWLALIDRGEWQQSWQAAAPTFQSHVAAGQWASMASSARQPLGAMTSRAFANVTRATSLPGAPAGDYEVVQFHTTFAGNREAVETITLAHLGSSWKTVGYYIR